MDKIYGSFWVPLWLQVLKMFEKNLLSFMKELKFNLKFDIERRFES